ncbi:LacI family DNA-binding transcriptional regulator [Oscillospiraceae bacterium PP1C4]
MSTISEIANKANVSRTLVSRVLNNKPGVSPENRKKILSVIEETNYVPNGLARALVMQKTQTIGVVMDELCTSFFFDLISGLQDAAEEMGYNILFCSSRSHIDIKQKYVDYFAQGRTDGIIAYGSNLTDQQLFRSIVSKSIPCVLVEGNLSNCNVNMVQLDNFKGAYNATKHLIELGYHNIVHVTGDMNYNVSLERLNGFVQAMQDFRIPIGQNSILYADYYEKLAYQQMRKLLEAGIKPDACFAGADKAAFGAIRALLEMGYSIPKDIAIIGFDDDVPESRDIVFPPLTTMRQPLYEMGRASVQMLVDSIKNPSQNSQIKMFQTELIIRKTCP